MGREYNPRGMQRRGQAMKTIVVAVGALAIVAGAAQARVVKIVIDETIPLPAAAATRPAPMPYEVIAGRAFGELDPKHPANALITDIDLAKDADGKVRYVASFVIYKPVDMSKASGLMWHDVPNRGRVFAYAAEEIAFGD